MLSKDGWSMGSSEVRSGRTCLAEISGGLSEAGRELGWAALDAALSPNVRFGKFNLESGVRPKNQRNDGDGTCTLGFTGAGSAD